MLVSVVQSPCRVITVPLLEKSQAVVVAVEDRLTLSTRNPAAAVPGAGFPLSRSSSEEVVGRTWPGACSRSYR